MKTDFAGTVLRSIVLNAIVVLMSFTIFGAKAQPATPSLKTVTVEAHSERKSNICIKYKQIDNSAGNSAWTQINRSIMSRIVGNSGANSVREYAKLEAKDYAQYYTDDYNKPYFTLVQSASIVRNRTVLCIVSKEEMYMGGAHPMVGMVCDCYSLVSGQRYDLSYLKNGQWSADLRRLLFNKCREKLGDMFQNTSGQVEVPDVVKLSSRGVVFIYQPYEIAPFSAGCVEIEVTDTELIVIGAPIRW